MHWGKKKGDDLPTMAAAPFPALDNKTKQRYQATISRLKDEIKAQHKRFKDKKAAWKAEKKSLQAAAEESLLDRPPPPKEDTTGWMDIKDVLLEEEEGKVLSAAHLSRLGGAGKYYFRIASPAGASQAQGDPLGV